jgi:hypothetical protein
MTCHHERYTMTYDHQHGTVVLFECHDCNAFGTNHWGQPLAETEWREPHPALLRVTRQHAAQT